MVLFQFWRGAEWSTDRVGCSSVCGASFICWEQLFYKHTWKKMFSFSLNSITDNSYQINISSSISVVSAKPTPSQCRAEEEKEAAAALCLPTGPSNTPSGWPEPPLMVTSTPCILQSIPASSSTTWTLVPVCK